MEVWKDIPGYEGLYEASSYGNIRSKEGKTTSSATCSKRVWKQRIMKQKYRKGTNGRLDAMITLWKNGSPHYYLVSRLIASTFCDNLLYTSMTVNHKDGNPLNNNADNLEWLSVADNIRYGFENGQFASFMKPVTAINPKNYLDKLFASSYAEMDRKLGQYRGYTSRMIGLNSDILYSKSGKVYHITPF